MSFIDQPLTISIFTSMIVSSLFGILSLVIAIRIGKERSDRAAMRSLYKSLHEHFREMQRRIEKREPAQWSDFPLQKDGRFPPVRELERTGDINLLPKHLAEAFLHAEREALIEAYRFKQHLDKVVGPRLLELVNEATSEPPVPISGKSYLTVTANMLAYGGERYRNDLKARLAATENAHIALGITEGDKVKSLYLNPDRLKHGTLEHLMDVLFKEASEAGGDLYARLLQRKDEIEILMPVIASRIRDPHPFAETVASLYRDLFDQASR